MDRPEEYAFRNDVYTTLIRFTNYKASGFLAGERKSCPEDNVFFSMLLTSSDELLGRAYRKGKMIALYTEPFLNAYKKVVNDELAYYVFVHQDELSSFTDSLIQSMSSVDTRFTNAFNRYWRDKCSRSVRILYYRTLITDSSAAKFDGIGAEPSRLMFEKILSFKDTVDAYLKQYTGGTPAESIKIEAKSEAVTPDPIDSPIVAEEPEATVKAANETSPIAEPQEFDTTQPGSVPFLNYVYDRIVTKEYPASAILLSVLRSRTEYASVFYEKVLDMDIPKARKELGIGEVSAKEVNKLCGMMRVIVQNPGSRRVFEESDKAALFAPRIEKLMVSEHIRVYHSYQKLMESCNGSVLDFYLKVIGASHTTAKFQGLNASKSRELLDTFKSLIPQIDAFLAGAKTGPAVMYNSQLHKLNLTDEQRDNIVSITEKSGHFPLFTAINYLMSKMDDRKFEIARRGLNTVYGQAVQDLNDIAPSLSISRERVRQLRDSCLDDLLSYPRTIFRAGLLDDYVYTAQSEYDFKHIRSEEGVEFSNEYITICIAISNPDLHVVGDTRKALLKTSGTVRRLYLVPTRIHRLFDFEKFLLAVEEMLKEKRFYPYRDDLEIFVRGLIKKSVSEEDFYDIVKECRQILLKGYPDNIINSQIYFPANARKTIPYLIEDILREFNRPMTAEEICEQLNQRYPDLEQIPSKIGPNALRNSNIVAVSRSSTYALAEWNYTEKRGGTIRDIVEEYLNSLIEPIASLSDICEYVAKYRDNVKESSVKSNLLAESSNKFSLFYKGDVMYIGYSDYTFDESYVLQEKRQRRRSFKDSVALLEKFILDNHRFPYSSGVSAEEIRLSRFLGVCKANIRKGLLGPDEQAAIERIESEYEQYKGKKERVTKEDAVPWMDRLENYVSYITINETLPPEESDEAIWFDENKALYDSGQLEPDKRTAFTALVKIVDRMNR